LVDVAPTIAELAGPGNKIPWSGESLVPFWKGATRELPAYSESYYANLLMGWAPLHSIRSRGKKWIDAPRPELYDLAKDPRELKNLYAPSGIPVEFRRELAKHKQAEASAQEREMDPETREKLASLGYVTGGGTKTVASSYDPKDGIAVWQQIQTGVAFAQRGQFDKGQKLLAQALQKQPDNVIAQKFMAAVLRKKGEYQEAIRHLQNALKSPLHRNDTRCALVEIHLDRKEYQDAQELLQVVLKEEPKSIRAFRLAATIAAETRNYQEAVGKLDRLLAIDPSDVSALSERGRLLSYLQRDTEALQSYEKVAAFRPLKEEEAVQVAAIHLTSKNTDAAEKYFRLALKANDQSVSAWKGLGLILAIRQQWAAAFEAFVNAGDCANAKTMLQKAPDIPSNEIEVFRKQCP
jgi:tetratricopeptide (TPR) repeat protein